MLHLITDTPGSCKTAFCVTKLDDTEKANKVNLVKNLEIYRHNKPLIDKYKDDFTYREYEIGSGHELQTKIDILPDDYFDFLGEEFDDLRPDYYYQRTIYFNEIIERINNRDGEQPFKFFLPVRTIYTNINALKIDYVRALTYDWRDCPDGSIVVIDEVQLVEPYSDVKNKNNPIIQDLTIHRHRGFDFYFITQYPSLLHPTVKVLIGLHYHLTRPYGMKTVVYQYGSAKDNPNAMVNKLNKETKFFFTPQSRIFKLYKSTTINTHQKRFPKGILFFVGWVILGIAFFIWNLSGDELKKSSLNSDKPAIPNNAQNKVNEHTKQQPATNANNPATTDTKEQPELTKEQLEQKLKVQEQAFKLELEKQKLEMIMQYEQLHKQFAEQQKQLQDFYARLEMYKTMLPKNYEIIKNDPNLQVRAVVKMGNKCNAYNTNGDLMTLSFDECNYYLQASGRVHRAAANGGTGATVTRLETKPVADILAENPDSHKQPPAPSQTPPNPDS